MSRHEYEVRDLLQFLSMQHIEKHGSLQLPLTPEQGHLLDREINNLMWVAYCQGKSDAFKETDSYLKDPVPTWYHSNKSVGCYFCTKMAERQDNGRYLILKDQTSNRVGEEVFHENELLRLNEKVAVIHKRHIIAMGAGEPDLERFNRLYIYNFDVDKFMEEQRELWKKNEHESNESICDPSVCREVQEHSLGEESKQDE
jgi:hypothetical protein